jgi:hypothetical protein
MGSLRKIIREEITNWDDQGIGKLPLGDISKWVNESEPMVGQWVEQIDNILPHLPRIEWGNLSHMNDKERLTAESLFYIKNELINIVDSLYEIKGNLENPTNW